MNTPIRPSHPFRATIPPVQAGAQRPRWSVMIPTYHCAGYLRETLASVLRQDLGPEQMQIEVIDDHSTDDDPAAVVQALGCGRVGFFQQPRNVGHTQNFATCLQRARGHLVHLLHGDDLVRDGFYTHMQRCFAEHPAIGAAFCRQVFVDEAGRELGLSQLEQPRRGILDNWLEHLALEQRIMTPSMVVRRVVYEHLGSFDARLVCAEDWEMWVRIAASYPIGYEPAPLAVYRMHRSSNTGRHIRAGEDIEYTRLAIELFQTYLPPATAAVTAANAKETYALAALDTAYDLVVAHDDTAAAAQVRAALRCRPSWQVLRQIVMLIVKGAVRGIRPMHPRSESRS